MSRSGCVTRSRHAGRVQVSDVTIGARSAIEHASAFIDIVASEAFRLPVERLVAPHLGSVEHRPAVSAQVLAMVAAPASVWLVEVEGSVGAAVDTVPCTVKGADGLTIAAVVAAGSGLGSD